MKKKIVLFLRVIIGASFILSGITKILAMTPFIETVYRFNVLPELFAVPFAALFPVFELVFGISLLIGYLTRLSAFCICGMLLMMLVAIVPQLLGGPKIADCGCFGGLMDSAVDINLLIRDVVMFGVVWFIFVQDEYSTTLDSWLSAGWKPETGGRKDKR
ncbi:DoxX family membrane protein [bacterium]|nr:DoxX family membrane protein [bacterium]